MKGEKENDQVIVSGMGEMLTLGNEEKDLLRLAPKFCLMEDLNEEEFEADLEECILKIKWEIMSEDDKEEPGLEDIALKVMLGKETCEEINQEHEEEDEIRDAEARSVFV